MTPVGESPSHHTVEHLLEQLEEVLPRALPTSLQAAGSDPTAGNDLYEAFLFSLVIRAAQRENYRVNFVDSAGNPPSEFRLRRSPGRIASGSFTHAVLIPPERIDPLEVHTGVKVVGKSRVAHEADVLVIPQSKAARCRRLDLDPRSSEALLAIEGKYYTTPVSLATGRQFLGLAVDLTRMKPKILAVTIAHRSLVHLLNGNDKDFEIGVLPDRKAAHDLMDRLAITLRTHRQGLSR